VGAFTAGGYDIAACTTHLRSAAGRDCMTLGCAARSACPVGPGHRYTSEHAAFHMAAFLREPSTTR
jgi:hypothetical protein